MRLRSDDTRPQSVLAFDAGAAAATEQILRHHGLGLARQQEPPDALRGIVEEAREVGNKQIA